MSKYLYPIYKLKTKSYIRWWLYNYLGKFNNYVLSEILTGTSFYLEDSTDRKFNIFDMIGRTTQESTTGKNLAEPGIERTVNGITFKNNTDGSTTLTGTSTAGVYNAVERRTLPAGTYYCYLSRTSTSSNIGYYLWDSDYQTIGQINQPFTLSEEKKVLIICGIDNAGVAVNETVKAQIEPGNVFTGWEKYTGGEPAPNPKYPFPIKNTGDNGSVNEKVSNSDGTQEQNISFPLAEGQKLMGGDYLADDGIHHKMGEVVLDGTENWVNYTSSYDGRFYCTTKHFRR